METYNFIIMLEMCK